MLSRNPLIIDKTANDLLVKLHQKKTGKKTKQTLIMTLATTAQNHHKAA